MNDKSALEKITGSVPVGIAANALAVAGAAFTPWAAFAPFLVQTLASGRQSARVESMLAQLVVEVSALKIDLQDISDDQHKLVGECIVSTFSTVDNLKLQYIRSAVLNALTNPTIPHGNADALGRLVRDISAAEAAFVMTAFKFRGVVIAAGNVSTAERLFVTPDSPEELLIGGLIRLGLLYSRSSMMYEWSPLTAKFIALIAPPNKQQTPV